MKQDITIQFDDGTKFYVPNFIEDGIQQELFMSMSYFEKEILDDLESYLRLDSVIFDVGANIGNHSIYWARRSGGRTVHAFEPVDGTFKMLSRNIELNSLESQIVTYNVALGAAEGSARISHYDKENIGATRLSISSTWDIKVAPLDGLANSLDRVDFIKIDTEGFELDVLKGSAQTIDRCKPVIFVEIFESNKKKVFEFMRSKGYFLQKQYEWSNFLFSAEK